MASLNLSALFVELIYKSLVCILYIKTLEILCKSYENGDVCMHVCILKINIVSHFMDIIVL